MKRHILNVGLLAMLGVAQLASAMPDKEFACKVQTPGVRLGVVFVQAYDMPAAKLIALEGRAIRMDGTSEAVQSVLECISFPGGRFTDREFQTFIESLPR